MEVEMTVAQAIGNRGTDTAFYNLMSISGEAILKLMGVRNPKNYQAKSVVLKDKQLFPDIQAWPVMKSDKGMIFIEFHGYKDSMINYRLASKVTMSCAHELYTGPVYMGVIFTERKFQQAAVALKLFSPDQKDWLTGSFTHIVLEDYTEQELLKIDPRLIILAPFTVPKRIRKSKKISLGHEWGQKLRKIFPESEHNSALDVMALFILNRFRTLTIEEVNIMLNFDITQTMVGKQLKQKYLEQGVKKGVKKGVKNGQILVAMNLLNKGFDIRIVQEMTELTEKDLKKLVLFLNK
jgi:uncharacterized LabA/DUF88 family protein